MNKYFLTLAAALSLSFVACSGKGDTGDSGTVSTDADADADADSDADPSFSVDWGGSAVTLSVSGGGSTYWWGIAETSSSADPWTGEDCVYGYTLSDGSVLGPYCHDAGATGHGAGCQGTTGTHGESLRAFDVHVERGTEPLRAPFVETVREVGTGIVDEHIK
jgi:hypothetical protein